MATLELALTWNDGNRRFKDRITARRVNAWRDIFPSGLKEGLQEKTEGESINLDFAPGTLVPAYDDGLVRELDTRRFRSVSVNGKRIPPRPGRFYPLGLFSGLPGVYPGTMTPARVLTVNGDAMTVDLNHPLARFPLSVEAAIQSVQDKVSDTGGLLCHWGEELCDNGPGMQARSPNGPTEFLAPGFLDRDDEDDGRFYATPRFVGHVDDTAGDNLTAMYGRFLESGMKVLDLMSSVQSHLPSGLELDVTGLGMNREEMEANTALAEIAVHDLNLDPAIPLSGPFDAVVVSLSVEYLADPVAVLREAAQRLVPGGVILIGVSNRWFPTKTTRGWTEMHEFERVGYLLQLLEEAGFGGPMGAESVRNDWRPQADRHFLETRGVSDPVHVVHAFRQ
ncbi:methyltransferase domain-containing protein [Pseudodesulfovibrio indicus]|uniref:methyltransferase domain-containing protein n=1 Tax=Pseudodesulfovibrio indicus TaxID=1716143 RepID=UPI002931BD94|nr:methyltransferase domain-containing protein [Pseudodesulfovibrio indicus]